MKDPRFTEYQERNKELIKPQLLAKLKEVTELAMANHIDEMDLPGDLIDAVAELHIEVTKALEPKPKNILKGAFGGKK